MAKKNSDRPFDDMISVLLNKFHILHSVDPKFTLGPATAMMVYFRILDMKLDKHIKEAYERLVITPSDLQKEEVQNESRRV